MKSLTAIHLSRRKTALAAFVVTSAMAALMTMATALSVTDFLQLIFPAADSGMSLSVSSAGGDGLTQYDANPVMRLLGRLYVVLAAMEVHKALLLYALLLLLLYGTKNVFSYLSAVLFARIKTGVLRDIRNGMHRSVLGQDFAQWSSQEQGQWLSRMSNDVAEYEANMLDSIQMIVSAALTMAIYTLMLLYLDWKLTLLVVVVMAVGTLLLSAPRRLKRQSRQLQALNGELMTTTQETLDSLKEIKAATAIEYVNSRQREQNRIFTRRRISLYRRIYAASPISDFVGNVIVVAILVIGASRVLGAESSMPAAMFVSYIMIYVLMLTPIKDFSNAIAQLKKGRGVEERIASAVCETPMRAQSPRPDEHIESIVFKDVTFSYGRQKVIERLNMTLSMHRHTAIVGESGSGKTTFGRLLAGLLQPSEGQILINDRPTAAAERAGRIAYIPQEPMLFNETLESNIRFGRQGVTRDEVEKAARMAQLGPLIDSLPEGLNTVIGDGGGRLSGGERQRVNIARALVGNPDVVVMDEATAALDAATEQRLTSDLRKSMGDRTMVVIAHRASTIASCDEVFNLGAENAATSTTSCNSAVTGARLALMLAVMLTTASFSKADTIPLQAQQTATRVVELTWSGTTGQTTVSRRYPGETAWSAIGATAAMSWTDRHHRAVCGDTVYYSVACGSDQGSAAVFVSDIDPTAPAEWGVVTVDELSQHIVLSWEPSADTDIMGYLVCEGTPSIAIDTVFGRLNTSYTYTLDSCLSARLFRVCAFDSCRQASALTSSCNNIVLALSAPPCSTTLTASWNHYQNMPSGVGAYELWISRDNAQYQRIAQVGNDISNYSFEVADGVADIKLHLKAVSANGQYVSQSNIVQHHMDAADRPEDFYLRKVSVYGDEKDVCVLGHTDPAFPVTDYTVYRSTDDGAFSAVGHCSPDPTGTLEWRDGNVQPKKATYSYCFGVTDACGRSEIRTAQGNTLSPKIQTVGTTGGVTLSWKAYTGWTGTTSYQIISSPIDSDIWQSEGSTTDTSYSLDGSGDVLLRYKVLAFEGANSQYRLFDSLQSVQSYHQPFTNIWMPNAFTPLENTNNTVRPRFSYANPEGYSFVIYNRQGQLVFSSTDVTESWDGHFGGTLQPMGAYVYKITYRQNDGTDQYIVGTITMIY
ncbi:MAG: ATP-binding cassette domain-containing protein [Bacteroidales bacterium]|nr:ATP-binding cassette domain-containing protein [Bacteroidales bacterium]